MQFNRPDSKIRFRRRTVIVDLDGTLTINGTRDPYAWDLVKHDLPNPDVVAVAQALGRDGNRLLYVSGRMDVCFADTLAWIRKHVDAGCLDAHLLMRKNGDRRPDEVVKRELYDKWIKPNYSILCVLDDRDKVVEMWRSIGLTCLQVAKAPF